MVIDHEHGQGRQERVYPYTASLMETMQTFGQTLDLTEHIQGIEWFFTEYRNDSRRRREWWPKVWFDFLLASESISLLSRPTCLL